MRLIKYDHDGKFIHTEDLFGDNIYPSAILSHRWGPEEVTFQDLVDGTVKGKASYHKIRFCADQAHHDGLLYFWVDMVPPQPETIGSTDYGCAQVILLPIYDFRKHIL